MELFRESEGANMVLMHTGDHDEVCVLLECVCVSFSIYSLQFSLFVFFHFFQYILLGVWGVMTFA